MCNTESGPFSSWTTLM